MSFSNPASSAKETAAQYTRSLLDLLGDREPLALQEELVGAVERAVAGLDDATLRTKEAPGKWSVLEVVQHLADTELVYGYRMRMIVGRPTAAIEGYDQDAWARELRYNDVSLADALDQLRALRAANLRFLRRLTDEQLDRVGIHSERGPESVRHIARLVAAHDLLHLRQIERIKGAIGAR